MTIAPENSLSITEAAAKGISRLAGDAHNGSPVLLTRHNIPVAAVVSAQELDRLTELEADLRDLILVTVREGGDAGSRTDLDDVLERFGYSREELEAFPDSD